MDVKVRELMSTKLVTLFQEQTLPLASEIMALRHIRHLPVVDDEGRVVGLVTHRDILAAQLSSISGITPPERDRLQRRVRVAEVMRGEVLTVTPDTPAYYAAEVLADYQFGCLPVVDESRKLVGIVTEADFLKFAMKVLRR